MESEEVRERDEPSSTQASHTQLVLVLESPRSGSLPIQSQSQKQTQNDALVSASLLSSLLLLSSLFIFTLATSIYTSFFKLTDRSVNLIQLNLLNSQPLQTPSKTRNDSALEQERVSEGWDRKPLGWNGAAFKESDQKIECQIIWSKRDPRLAFDGALRASESVLRSRRDGGRE